jgi:hypothetical protein
LHINNLATNVLHHISLSYLMHCIILLSAHSCAIVIDHTELELEVQAEQKVQWVFGGPQASSCKDANIAVIKASPSACNHYP